MLNSLGFGCIYQIFSPFVVYLVRPGWVKAGFGTRSAQQHGAIAYGTTQRIWFEDIAYH